MSKKQNRVELLVESIAVEKQIIDELSDDLIAARDAGDKNAAKEVAKKLEAQIKRYNTFVKEYNSLTGEKVAYASPAIVANIMGGSNTNGLAGISSANAQASTAVTVLNQKELNQYLAKSDKTLDNVKAKLADTVKYKNAANGYNKVLLIVNCLTLQRYIVERLSENLSVCCQVSDFKKVSSIRKKLSEEIANYNRFVGEYEAVTGSKLTRASTNIPADIIAGKPYAAIPAITYMANDGTMKNSTDETAAIGAQAEAEVEKAKNKKKAKKKADEEVQLTALEAKIAEQANKDVEALAQAAAFKLNILKSERDIESYRFGAKSVDVKKRNDYLDKQIKELEKNNKAALKCENADNERYYAVVKNDPVTMKAKKKNHDAAKVAEVRTQMMALLNKRDEINSKLLAIYNGIEVNLDGSAVNQTWREVKNAAAEKAIKKDTPLAKKVAKLSTSAGEKQKIYDLMNRKVDAVSTLALCEYRIKKEAVSASEKKQLKKDVKNMQALVKQIDADINWIMKKIRKRG